METPKTGEVETKVKPALKKHPLHSGDRESPPPPPSESKKKKALKWDEEAIEEHDQLRGTRMKIEEPNTPYTHYDSGAESDSSYPKSPLSQRNQLNWEDLQNKLTDVAVQYPSSPSDCGDDEEKKLRFRERRKKHYNEMELVRKFRAEHADDEDDDDDVDIGDDEMETK